LRLTDDKAEECVFRRMRICSGEKKAKDEILQITMKSYCVST